MTKADKKLVYDLGLKVEKLGRELLDIGRTLYNINLRENITKDMDRREKQAKNEKNTLQNTR